MQYLRSDNVQNDLLEARRATRQNKSEGWNYLWQEGFTNWDRGRIMPALEEALKLPELAGLQYGKALVPGCGRGYDAIYIASSLGCQTLGLDFSAAAVEEANKLIIRSQGVPVSFRKADFFKFKPEDISGYDIIYDYAFFCAIPPKLRRKWGKKMTRLTQLGGYLITVCCPIDGDRKGGPPYSVDVNAYAKALGQQWENVIDKVPENCTFPGRERLVVWKKAKESRSNLFFDFSRLSLLYLSLSLLC